LLFLSLFPFFSSNLSAQNLKVGVVDTEKIYSSYKKAQNTQKSFQAERKAKQEELAKKQGELQRMKEEYEGKKSRLRESEKKDYEVKIADKEKEIREFTRQTNAYLLRKNQALTQERLKEISDTISAYAQENKIDLVIDKKYTPYFSLTLTISDKIIEKLNSQKKGGIQ